MLLVYPTEVARQPRLSEGWGDPPKSGILGPLEIFPWDFAGSKFARRSEWHPWPGSQLRLGDLQRPQQAHRLVHRLLVLARRDAVGDDAGAGLHVGRLAEDDHRPQRDAGVHVPAEVDVADRAAVGPAAVRLQ